MEEPVSLTVGAVSALLNNPEENSGENLADTAKVAVTRLVGWLRDGFTQTGDKEGSQAFARTEDAPDSPSRMTVLVDVVGRRRATDSEFKSAGATTGG